MDVWTEDARVPRDQPLIRNRDGGDDGGGGRDDDHTRPPPPPSRREHLSHPPAPRSTEPPFSSDVTDTAGTTLLENVAAEAPDDPESIAGLPSTGPSCLRNYLVLARLFKVHPDFDTAVEGILAGDTDGCVVLIHETTDEEWTRVVWRRLRGVLVPRGVYDRLRIMHHWLYPQALRRATAVLDTFPYGGCLTVLEGLSNGVPVVTLPADFVRGRFALAMYRQMEYTDLVADNVEEYVSLAVRLGTDQAFRKEAVVRVREAYRVSLHKNQQCAREWAAFFVRAYRAGSV